MKPKTKKTEPKVHMATHVEPKIAEIFDSKSKPIPRSLRLRMLINDFNSRPAAKAK